jgi:phosphoserine aminotransferase
MSKPAPRPHNPNFSCGPCAKPPGWSLDALKGAVLGRSHRSTLGKNRLQEVIDRTRAVLAIPADYRIAIVPASDTGAVEMAMWSLLGARGTTVLAWENFSQDWAIDAKSQLKLKDLTLMEADYGQLPDLSKVDFNTDVVFAWNGTTSGVKVPDANWIPTNRAGLTICDATSAVFAMPLPWDKLDVTTWSWQKVLGGEAAHGMIVLSPRAVERLESYTPPWPLPKLFRMTSKGKITEGLFKGETINTPSMLCVEDVLFSLKWAESLGGAAALIKRSEANAAALDKWVQSAGWVDYLPVRADIRSTTSVCLKIVDPWFTALGADAQAEAAKKIASILEKEGVAFDIASYRTAPPGLRIWCGATVEASDIAALGPWLDWAYGEVKQSLAKAA